MAVKKGRNRRGGRSLPAKSAVGLKRGEPAPPYLPPKGRAPVAEPARGRSAKQTAPKAGKSAGRSPSPRPGKGDAGSAARDDVEITALDLPPAPPSAAMQAYFAKCEEKLSFVPNVLTAYAFD